MSVEAASVPLTALAWASGSSTCPNDFKLMSVEAASVPLTALAWASGSSTCPNDFKLKPQGSVITDIQFVSEKESLPSGFYYIAEFLEPSEYHDVEHTAANHQHQE
ncbi:UNVERIFIED_CONTAM: hypothetical protein FKN15_037291 [Acipenser sinensis]